MAVRKSSILLPEVFRTSKNTKFLNATLDQLISEETKRKFSGFIGRKNAENFTSKDTYLTEINNTRQNYQLEPGVVYQDSTGDIKSVSSIIDALNTINYNNGQTANQDKLYRQEFYNWSSFIDFDKLINYGEYFWLPSGPDAVNVFAGTVDSTQDYTVLRSASETVYRFDSATASVNPTLYLARGGEYTFRVDQPGIPFWIQTERGLSGIDSQQKNISTREVLGVINNGEDAGTVTFRVPLADAQSNFTDMTTDAVVDLATELTYSELHNQTLSAFLASYPTGIDNLTQLDGKDIIMINDTLDETRWNQGANFDAEGYDSGTVEGSAGTFDPVTALTHEQRYSVFRLDVNAVDGVDTIQLSLIQSITQGNKVYVSQGTAYGSREFYKDPEGFLRLIPNITAGQSELFYQDGADVNRNGKIILVDQGASSTIDLVNDVLGRETYTSPNGVAFTNGLKVEFDTSVTPALYQNNRYYVEGVGSAIKLVAVDDLVTPESYVKSANLPYDSTLYDEGNFESTLNSPVNQDYIVINRSSGDNNAWSRGNRWFHRNVITATASYNNFNTIIDDAARAKRPIIEFDSGLKLFNMGITSKTPVTVIDTVQTDAFSNVNGTLGYYSDGIELTPGVTIIFSADPDIRQNIYRVDHIDQDANIATAPIINLVKIDTVSINDSVLSSLGSTNQGKVFYYTTDSAGNNIWKLAQQKTKLNQEPLFDVFDGDHVSFGDTTKYASTNFTGNKLFSYKRNNNASADTILGFGLTYKNIANVGDIVFENNYITDKFQYTSSTGSVNVIIKSGHAHKYNGTTRTLHNGWTKVKHESRQWQQIQHIVDSEKYVFEIGSEPKEIIGDVTLQVFVNGTFQTADKYSQLAQNDKFYVTFNSALATDDVVLIRVYSDTVNPLGFYEVASNLENNANNADFETLTLGQCRNHFIEITRNIAGFTGKSLGSNNARDLTYKNYSGKILQHSAGGTLAHYLLTMDDNLFVSSMKYSLEEYTRFKNRLLDNLDKLDIDLRNPSGALDTILTFMVGSKSSDFPFYYTDMLPWGSEKTVTNITLDQTTERTFEFTTQFDLTSVSSQGVLVYLNEDGKKTQLVYGKDYTFDTVQASVTLNDKIDLAVGDVIEIVEYANTNGSFVPPTPSKLGLYPKFQPSISLDDTYQTGTSSGTGPFKIYGTSDSRYVQRSQGQTGWYYPLYTTSAAAAAADSAGQSHPHKFEGTDRIFYMPSTNQAHGAIDTDAYEEYKNYTPVIVGHDGSRWVAYKDLRDRIILEYETRVYNNIKTNYNPDVFNILEISSGYFRDTLADFALDNNIIGKYFATWAHKNQLDYITNTQHQIENQFTWNYNYATTKDKNSRLPGYWRAIYRWLYDTETPHLTPWEMIGFYEKPSYWDTRYGRAPYTRGNYVLWQDLEDGKRFQSADEDSAYTTNDLWKRPGLTNLIPVDDQGKLIPPGQFLTQGSFETNTANDWRIGDTAPVEAAWKRSSEWPFVVQILAALKRPAKYFALLWDANLVEKNTGYDQILQKNKSYRHKISDYKLNGTTIGTTTSVNRVEGYNQFLESYLKFKSLSIGDLQTRVQNLQLKLVHPIAGYTNLAECKLIIESTTPSSTSNNIFVPDENLNLYLNKSTPLERITYSGVNVTKRVNGYEVTGFDTDNPFFKIIPSLKSPNNITVTVGNTTTVVYQDSQKFISNIPYGTIIPTKQQLCDFMVAYQRYLVAKGFIFEDKNSNDETKDFALAIKEFLLWDQQGWPVNSVIGISPANNEIRVNRPFTTIDNLAKTGNIKNPSNKALRATEYNVSRIDNLSVVTVNADTNQIYSAQLDPIQYEHYLVVDNTTIFNDVIYQPELGNRQARIKFVGFKSNPWNGTLHSPGFINNANKFDVWVENTDYKKGDIVNHNKKLYAAVDNHTGETKFNFNNWRPVTDMKTGLLPNITQKADRFTDFYDFDKSNLESSTDKAAKGQIGFRPRDYLDQLGLDDVSQVKFYQGMVRNKGTKNVIDRLTTAELTNLNQEIEVFEEWGFRAGAFGSIDSNQVIELIVDEARAQENQVTVELLNAGDTGSGLGLAYYSGDLLKIPNKYDKNIFNTRTSNVKKTDIIGAGHVRIDDADLTVFDLENNLDQITANIATIGRGTTIWNAKGNLDWDIYRVTEINAEIISLNQSGTGFITYTTNRTHTLVKDDYIVIKSADQIIGGAKQVHSTYGSTQFTIRVDDDVEIDEITGLVIAIYKLTSSRFANTSNIATFTPPYGWQENELAWVDYDENQNWATFKKSTPWNYKNVSYNIESVGDSKFGTSLAITDDSLSLFVGSPEQSVGVVYPYSRDSNGVFNPGTSIVAQDIRTSIDAYGFAVAAGTEWLAVGAPSSESSIGYVFMYKRDYTGVFTNLTQSIRLPSPGAAAKFGYSVSISKDDRYLFVGAPGENKVHIYTLVEVASSKVTSQTFTGDNSTTAFTLDTAADNSYQLYIKDGNGKEYLPFKDWTVSGTTLTFTTAPAASLSLVVRRQSYFNYSGSVTGSSTLSGDQFGFSLDVDTTGETLIVGAPYSDVDGKTDAGSAYMFHHIVERFTGNGTSHEFTATTTLPDNFYIEVDGVKQSLATGSFGGFDSDSSENRYTVVGNTISFRYIPALGTNIRVYTGSFVEMQIFTQQDAIVSGETPQDNENFGYSVALDAYGAIATVGSPGEDETNPNTGSVFVFIDEGLRFGEVTTTSTNKSTFTTQFDSISVDDFEVTMSFNTSADPARFATPINTSTDLVNINATLTTNGQVKITSTSTVPNKKLKVRPGVGTTFRALAEVRPFKFAQKINHPFAGENENFGRVVEMDKFIPVDGAGKQRLVISSDRATTLLPAEFDIDTNTSSVTYDEPLTTFDANSTKFIDKVSQSGAAYVYDLLDSSNTISNPQSSANPPKFAFGQQLRSINIGTLDEFGGSVAINAGRIFVGSPADDIWLSNAGSFYLFENTNNTDTWNKYRVQTPKVDIDVINRIVTYDKTTNEIQDFIDTVDIYKNKLPGIAQGELDYILPIDPAVYNVSTIQDQVTYAENNNWNDEKVGRLWWDLSTCRVIEYEQGDLEYRSQHWNQFFPGSSIDIYEWTESTVPPSLHVASGLPGTPKHTDDSAYSVSLQYNSITNTSVTRYYYWVTGLTTFPNDERRQISTEGVRQLIENPMSTGTKYISIIDKNAFVMNNMSNSWADRNTVLSINYDVVKNEGIVHSEFELVSEGDDAQILPANIKAKLIDSLAGADKTGAVVPDATLSAGERYGIAIRPRQTMFVNRQAALKTFVNYCNNIFASRPIARQFVLTSLFASDPQPSSLTYDKKVPNVETRDFLAVLTLPAGYKVLVEKDETNNDNWSLYTLQIATDNTRTWNLTRVQGYNTARYWDYVTWYATGFDNTTIPKYTVSTEPDLLTLTSAASGDIAKVLSNDDGNFSLFQYNGTIWTEVIIEKGTIKILDTVYDFNNIETGSFIGFDTGVFEFANFDRVPHQEVRTIATAVFNEIFTGELALNANILFFRMVEYALHEVNVGNPDWLLKTSFIRVLHKIRDLDQYPTYQLDNSTFVEEYINEVKPYHTTIREYVAKYDGVDNWNGDVTDFDLHSFYDSSLEYFRKPSGDYGGDEITRTQGLNQPWSQNYTYYVDSIVIVSAGTGFLDNPVLTISAPDVAGGTQATAIAVTNGSGIVRVTMTNKGSGYTKNPTITITGQGTGLKLSPRLKNDQVREFDTTLKFDRITYSTTVKDWAASTTYANNDLVAYYNTTTKIQEVYQVNKVGGFTTGTTFSVEDTTGATVLVPYADENLTSAADRIGAYYVPSVGMIGDDLELLQPGTGYLANKVSGLGFDKEPGFDSSQWDVGAFDDFEIDTDGLTTVSGLDTVIKSTFSDLALGTRPEDIDVDGGKFVDVYNSHAPEEFVPGIVFDNLDMEVYTDPSDDFLGDGNSFKTVSRTYIADGLNNKFSYGSQTRKELVDYLVVYQGSTRIFNFTVDYEYRTISFASTPVSGTNIRIYGYGVTGEKLTHEEVIIGDGSTLQFTLGLEYRRFTQLIVLVDGVPTDVTTSQQNLVVNLTFYSAPSDGAVIHVLVSNRSEDKPAFTYGQTQEITLTSGTYIYNLDQAFDDDFANPLTGNIIVELGTERLRPANSEYYTLDGSTLSYLVPHTAQETAVNTSTGDISVTRLDKTNNVTQNLAYIQDYTITETVDATSTAVYQVNLLSAYNSGDTLIVSVENRNEFYIDAGDLRIDPSVSFVTGDKVYVTSFNNHDPLRIQTKVFIGQGSELVASIDEFDEVGYDSGDFDAEALTGLALNKYTLDRTPTSGNNLWVTLDGIRLHAGEFTIDNNGRIDLSSQIVNANSEIIVTHFSENKIEPTIGYRMVNDMLGNYEYFRLCNDGQTQLSQDLLAGDTKIYVEDARKLPLANPTGDKPGVIYVGNERITYWEISYEDNYVTNIRRSTMGTRWAPTHLKGTQVYDTTDNQRLPATDTHTKTWYTVGNSSAADGNGLQSSVSVNAAFLKACEAALPNFIAENNSPKYIEDGYVDPGYVEELEL